MRALSSPLRKRLEAAVLAGRRAAESASRAAIEALGVLGDRRPEHLDVEQAALRNGLRAKWRQLGNDKELLVGECAYEQWHRLLFARFLAENDLLLHPQYRAAVTLEDCEELARELGEPDGWSVAARFAAEILPGIFRLDDPCVRLRLAPEGRHALEQVIAGLPPEVFTADDALGWVYQFWQKDKKDEVNASERKIGGADLGPVTQLFTENYMVRFLLENSLGAWWASRHSDSPLVGGFEYLRFDGNGEPAAGSFDGWPERVAEVTVMDPCCGSGHFLVEAFSMLWQMRAEEESLDPAAAQDAVLHDNLFGLELDPRCVQIAMFALALAAWKVGGGWRQLPIPHIACSGIQVNASVDEWTALAKGEDRLVQALTRLHEFFRGADTLGSLIDPRRAGARMDATGQREFEHVDWEEVAPLLETATQVEVDDPATAVLGADAAGIARAADLLSREYTLATTNVPYLKRSRQSEALREYCDAHYPDAKHDLAMAMLDRLRALGTGEVASVLPHGWLFMSWYRGFRRRWLTETRWNLLAHLGTGAFGSISGEVVNVILASFSGRMTGENKIVVLDAHEVRGVEGKGNALKEGELAWISQEAQLRNPDTKVILEGVSDMPLLEGIAGGYAGVQSGDYPRFGRYFWELPTLLPGWAYQQSTVRETIEFGGREHVFFWENGEGRFVDFVRERLGDGNEGAWIRGANFAGRWGVAVSSMSSLPVTLYTGELFDNNTAVIMPRATADLPAIWAFARSGELAKAVRRIDASIKVTNATFVKVPFDEERWRREAEEAGGLPEPWSNDPTQWLFEGRPKASTAPLQVAVGRLLGYRWSAKSETDDLDDFADVDGIVCLPSVAGESAAAERLQRVLALVFGHEWSPTKSKELLERAGSKKPDLADWLRDEFFKQHCALFGNRPFVWHIWDGQRDGFSTLVNYHRFGRKALEKLTYTYLGQDWVERQRAGVRDQTTGAEARLTAALDLQRKLEAILAGEKPYDIYVRWKEPHEQPVGWEPDLNDGVRLNVRPFVEAEVLRTPFNIHWKKDRGKNPDGSERHNDIHLSLAEKLEARRSAGGG